MGSLNNKIFKTSLLLLPLILSSCGKDSKSPKRYYPGNIIDNDYITFYYEKSVVKDNVIESDFYFRIKETNDKNQINQLDYVFSNNSMNKEEVNIGSEKYEEYLCDSIIINDESFEKPTIINYELKVKTAYKLTTFIMVPEEASLIYLDFSFNNFNYRFNGDDFLIYDEFTDVNKLN